MNLKKSETHPIFNKVKDSESREIYKLGCNKKSEQRTNEHLFVCSLAKWNLKFIIYIIYILYI